MGGKVDTLGFRSLTKDKGNLTLFGDKRRAVIDKGLSI